MSGGLVEAFRYWMLCTMDFDNTTNWHLAIFAVDIFRVARWYICRQNAFFLGGPWIGNCWYILRTFGIFYSHFEYFVAISNILWTFGNFTNIWYIFPRFGVLYKEKSGNPGHPSVLQFGRRHPNTVTVPVATT
jgi:hypothetical protein